MWCINIKKRIRKSSDLGDDITGGNANSTTAKISYGHSVTNAPSLQGHTILTLPYSSDLRCAQIAADVESGNKFHVRSKIGGTYTGWEKLLTNSDLVMTAKIDRSADSAWVGNVNNEMIFSCNKNTKKLVVTFSDGTATTFNGV